MTDKEFKALFEDAVADLVATPDVAGMSGRLQRVDKLRRAKTFVMATILIVAATAGAAAAWPSDQEPIQIRMGDGGMEVDNSVDDRPVEEAQADDGEFAVLVEPTPTPTPMPEHRVLVDLSALSQTRPLPTPTPTPKLEAVVPPHEPVHVDPVKEAETDEHAKKQGKKGNKKAKNDGGEDPGEESHEPSGESGASHQLTAVAAYGSCEEPVPYDIYSGHAGPGGQVTISSPYSATATVNADGGGQWSKQVTFEDAPVGEHFTVTISSGGGTVSLGFVRTG